jgi:DNA-binding protein HU-beta
MTKLDIINEIVDTTGIAKKDATVAVESFMKVVRDAMCEGENVYLRGFGTFQVKKRAEKTARNISKNTTITVPAHNFPGFKPAKSFLQKMKGEEVTAND